ncbi:thiolase family protein [Marinovum sp.]|uniref:thiolase family protein n=1 Tax=Marinovum sp. TaxID=2024839 RepID=UPI002B268E49|nr:thiolase family protein [Marinovum sp.]
MSDVRIAGGAMTPFNRRKDASSWRDWCLSAFTDALADAALMAGDIDALMVASESDFFSLQLNPAALIADELGLRRIRVQRVEGGGATGHLAVQAGAALVSSGQARRVAVLGVEASASHLDGASVGGLYSLSYDAWSEGESGIGSASIYALSALAFMAETGATSEDFARIAARNRQNARHNRFAHLPLDVTEADVLASAPVSTPYRRLDCSPLSDGAACVILAASQDLPEGPGRARLAGMGVANDRVRLGDRAHPGCFTAKGVALRAALAQAGCAVDQIGLAEVYDSFSGAQLQALQALGLTADPLAAERDGQFTVEGALPVNLSGGLLGQGAPVGATGVAQVLAAAQQLEGRYPGLRPARAPRFALVDTHGGIATLCAVSIVEAPR